MGNLQYIGARYVPKYFLNPDDQSNDWKSGVLYEALTIVTYNNDSYTSKIVVPANIGNPADNPYYWACTTKYTAALSALQTIVGNLTDDVDEIKAQEFYVTPQMFGAVGDGLTDDTAAFSELVGITNDIIIPKGNYVINSALTIGHVIADYGTYTNYVPQYAKPLKLPVQGVTFGENLSLPVAFSYLESLVRLGNKYYGVTYEALKTGVIEFDENFNVLNNVTLDAGFGVASNITTDGVYLYIDFGNARHCKFDVSDLTTPVLDVNTGYNFTCFYNHQLYAITINLTNVVVSKIDDTLTTLTDSFVVNCPRQTLQSAMIYKGQVYIPTVEGYCYLIDLTSHELLSVLYNSFKEIECFFDDNGELKAAGHYEGMEGIFNIGTFTDGIDYPLIQNINVDCNDVDVHYYFPQNRPNIYNVVNADTSEWPISDFNMIILDKMKLLVSTDVNKIFYKDGNTWKYLRNFSNKDAKVLVPSQAWIHLQKDGMLYLDANSLELSDSTNTYSLDLSDYYSLMNVPDGTIYRTVMIGRTNNAGVLTSDVYVAFCDIGKTSQAIYVLQITGTPGPIDAQFTGNWKLFTTNMLLE